MSTHLASLIAAQTGATVPAAAGPDLSAFYHYTDANNQAVSVTGAQLSVLIDSGYTGPVIKAGDTAWKTAADYGFIKTVAATVVPPAPTAAPPAPVAPPVAATPPAPAAPTAPPVTAAPPATTALATTTPPFAVGAPRADAKNPGFRALAPLVTDAAAAKNMLASFMGAPAAGPGTSLREAMDAADGGGMMSHSLPFCNLRKGNWTDTSSADKPAPGAQYLPAGTRPYSALLLGYRYGATGWKGDASNDGSKSGAPLYRFVLPTLEGNSGILPLTTEVLKIARKIQFTGRSERAKFDILGRMTLETQVLVWVPDLPIGVLCVSGWEASNLTSKSVDEALRAGQRMQPFSVTVGAHQQVNDNKVKQRELYLAELAAAKAANRACTLKEVTEAECSWTTSYGKFTLDTGPVGLSLRTKFQEWIANEANVVSLANTFQNFNTGADYSGLSVEEVEALTSKYAPFLD